MIGLLEQDVPHLAVVSTDACRSCAQTSAGSPSMSVETHLTKRIRPQAPRQLPVHPCTATVHCHAAAVAPRVV